MLSLPKHLTNVVLNYASKMLWQAQHEGFLRFVASYLFPY